MLRAEEYNYRPGTKLVLELINHDILEGICANVGRDRIDLIQIILNANNCKIPGPQSYYRSEIESVRVFNTDEAKKRPSLEAEKEEESVILIPKQDYDDLRLMTQNYKYLSTVDANYYEAIKHLQMCENIGIACITETFDKFSPLSVLAISSWNQVYVFDIKSFGLNEFPKDLKAILESPHVQKVLHDARLPHGVLLKQYKVEMMNIFDTMCADVILQRKKSSENGTDISIRSIAECFKHYFHFPDSFIEIYKSIQVNKWHKRPLSDSRKFQASQLCSYLIYLKNHLEYLMMQNFLQTCDLFAESFQVPINYDVKKDAKDIVSIYESM